MTPEERAEKLVDELTNLTPCYFDDVLVKLIVKAIREAEEDASRRTVSKMIQWEEASGETNPKPFEQ